MCCLSLQEELNTLWEPNSEQSSERCATDQFSDEVVRRFPAAGFIQNTAAIAAAPLLPYAHTPHGDDCELGC